MRGPFQFASSVSSSDWCGTPFPIPASDSACRSVGLGAVVHWHLHQLNTEEKTKIQSVSLLRCLAAVIMQINNGFQNSLKGNTGGKYWLAAYYIKACKR